MGEISAVKVLELVPSRLRFRSKLSKSNAGVSEGCLLTEMFGNIKRFYGKKKSERSLKIRPFKRKIIATNIYYDQLKIFHSKT